MITGNMVAAVLIGIAVFVVVVLMYVDLVFPDPADTSSDNRITLDEGITHHEFEHPFLLYPRRYEAMSAAARRRRRKAGPILSAADKEQTVIEAVDGVDCHTCGEDHYPVGPLEEQQSCGGNPPASGFVKNFP